LLTIPPKKLGFIIAKAREFDAEIPIDPDAASRSNPADDDERQILFDTPDNSARDVREPLETLNV
jgi:hypothetical protein